MIRTSWLSRTTELSDQRFSGAVFSIALAVRLIWILVFQTAPVSDMHFFFEQGKSIAVGAGYVSNGEINGYTYADYPAGAPTADRPVGYSAFLALLFWLFGPSVLVGTAANIVLSAASVAMFYFLSMQLQADRGTARIVALALVFFPNQIAYCGLLSDSVFLQFCLILGLLLMSRPHRWWSMVAAGAVFGIVALTRSYAALVPLVWGLILWRKAGWRVLTLRLGAIVLAIGMVMLPWAIRNQRAFGELSLTSTNFGYNLLAGHNSDFHGKWTPTLPQLAYEPGFKNEVERDRALRRIAFEYMLDHPLRTVAMAVPKVFYMFAEDADGLRWTIKGRQGKDELSGSRPGLVEYQPAHYLGMALFQAYYLVVLLGFLGYAVARIRGRLRCLDPHALGLWTVGLFTLVSVVFFGISRFHYPIVPFLTLYATWFYFQILSLARRSRSIAQPAGDLRPGDA